MSRADQSFSSAWPKIWASASLTAIKSVASRAARSRPEVRTATPQRRPCPTVGNTDWADVQRDRDHSAVYTSPSGTTKRGPGVSFLCFSGLWLAAAITGTGSASSPCRFGPWITWRYQAFDIQIDRVASDFSAPVAVCQSIEMDRQNADRKRKDTLTRSGSLSFVPAH